MKAIEKYLHKKKAIKQFGKKNYTELVSYICGEFNSCRNGTMTDIGEELNDIIEYLKFLKNSKVGCQILQFLGGSLICTNVFLEKDYGPIETSIFIACGTLLSVISTINHHIKNNKIKEEKQTLYEVLKEYSFTHDKKLKDIRSPILEYSLQDSTEELIRN